ncbi:phosphate ABC transporter substrate-binding protein [Saccharothrix sp. NRRL B-16348]|uniref:putative selenate ABC transporter substrate-binding protein n=1 Tax=Saccharothrix sp. NRRL B-16348 TaxID=1415542 RepID=UPI0006AFF00C|nr:putative selenate ABC transporter substrate-binding protein [Saccharothrix sp. NRRL B-16348]KOX34849.1 phosphate ABC transporter substrate-binding protein [Saccharothrix sp. NRRL B-16348]
MWRVARAILLSVVLVSTAACGAGAGGEPGGLRIGAIPDQDPQQLQRMYGVVSDYLHDRLGVQVEYVPVRDYAAAVAQFERGDLDLVFFGGLTGVQARKRVPGAAPVAQRDVDAQFRSVFVANPAAGVEPFTEVGDLARLKGHSFTFGSDTSTSGRLMPQYFLDRAGVSLDDFTGEPGYSGSHDATLKLVESGAYQVGVLSASVWEKRVQEGKVDPTTVREVFRTPTYHDYHWLARPDLDQRLGQGFTDLARDALLSCDGSDDREKQVLDLFAAGGFVAAAAEDYAQIEAVAGQLGLLR